MCKPILHISCDDQFLNYAVDQFDNISEVQSDFIMMDYSRTPGHLKRVDRIKYFQVTSDNLRLITDSFLKYSAIIFHGLNGNWSRYLLSKVPENLKVAWVCWGNEVWGINEEQYYAPITKAVWTLKGIKDRIFTHKKVNKNNRPPTDLLNRIDYCLTDMESECEAANRILGTSMQWLPYNYYSIEHTIGELKEEKCVGHNMFIGNAAYWGNNLLDSFWLVHKYKGKIIVPLNNGSQSCVKAACWFGKLILGKRFNPMLKYLPLAEYNNKIRQCSHMLQYQFHPQSQGNIITGLWMGQKVFLSKKNPTYNHFKSLGVHIYSVEDDLRKEIKEPILMTDSECGKNRRILLNYYGFEAMQKHIEIIVNKLNI